MLARRAEIELVYQGVNISGAIAKDLVSFTYTDNASGMADSISIILKDEQGKWISSWAPEQGDKITASIRTTNWRFEGESQELKCGTFMVDEPEYSGPARKLALNAVGLPANNDFRDTKKSRTWKGVTVRKMANDIAYSAGLKLFYDTAAQYTVSYLEQSEQSDSELLEQVCTKYGLVLKIYNDRIVVYSQQEYEQKPKIGTITPKHVTDWTARKTLTETGYDACVVTYTPPKTGKKLQYTFKPKGTTNKVLRINQDVASVAEAEVVAKAELRKANIKQYTMTFEMLGNVYLIASYTLIISGFGVFDGNYFIDQVEHVIDGSNGYSSKIEVHRILEGGY